MKIGDTMKKTIFSGMQATGMPSLGNYIGAISNWAKLQYDYNSLFCVVDLHSITVRQNPAELSRKAREVLALYIASGIDPEESVLYFQSHVSGHAELSWILSCYTYMGEMNRMTQYKDKAAKHADNINAGLFTYPILMAADILLFQTHVVPVGEDQRQHLELCRDVAMRMNKIYGDMFVIPEPYIAKHGARIMSLQDPSKKMSKSETENLNNVIFMLDDSDTIMKKLKKAVTDSDGVIRYGADKPGVSNLLEIFSFAAGMSVTDAVAHFEGKGYGALKIETAEAVIAVLAPIQARFRELLADREYLDRIIRKNAERANALAAPTIEKVKRMIGFPVL